MGVRGRIAAYAVAISCALAGSARATIYTITYHGTVVCHAVGWDFYGGPEDFDGSGTDGAGLFGPAGASLLGDAFTAAFTLDESLLEPGLLEGGNNPMVSATLTINGEAQTFSSGWSDFFTYRNLPLASEVWSGVWSSGVGGGIDVMSAAGEFEFFGAGKSTDGALLTSSYSISPDIPSGSATPEPETWALIILGVASIGFAARRQIQTKTRSYDRAQAASAE